MKINHHKYFGTDGIRGKFGNTPITPEFFLKLGFVIGKIFSFHRSKKIILGKDTRMSSNTLEFALSSGILSSGLSILFVGLVPTPSIAYFTKLFQAAVGIVISASHNPFYENGIKFFSIDGKKISRDIEKSIESEIKKPINYDSLKNFGKIFYVSDSANRYIEFCIKTISENNLNLLGLRIVVDCANGSTYRIAPNIFKRLGADVITINCSPNGENINKMCGTTDVRFLKKRVILEKADLGIAYDGDGDRVMMVDHLGYKVDGDKILYILAKEKLRNGKLHGGVVGTLMSNTGLRLALKKLGIPFICSDIGDRNVLNMMKKNGCNIGAENSGHIILSDKTTTGDGIIVGLTVLSIMVKSKKNLHELCKNIYLFPQKLLNVSYTKKRDPLSSKIIKKAISKVKKKLCGQGRVVLRKSGTESVVRIMVEGKNKEKIGRIAYYIANAVRQENQLN